MSCHLRFEWQAGAACHGDIVAMGVLLLQGLGTWAERGLHWVGCLLEAVAVVLLLLLALLSLIDDASI